MADVLEDVCFAVYVNVDANVDVNVDALHTRAHNHLRIAKCVTLSKDVEKGKEAPVCLELMPLVSFVLERARRVATTLAR